MQEASERRHIFLIGANCATKQSRMERVCGRVVFGVSVQGLDGPVNGSSEKLSFPIFSDFFKVVFDDCRGRLPSEGRIVAKTRAGRCVSGWRGRTCFCPHARTDLAKRVARDEALIVGICVHFDRGCVGGEEWKHAGEFVLATLLYSAGGRRKNVTPLLNLGKLILFKHSCQGRAMSDIICWRRVCNVHVK